MKSPVALVALTSLALLSKFAPALAAPAPESKAPAKTPIKPAVDPLDIPAFAPIPNEFVFAGTQKDVYKLLSRYTGGVSLDQLPEVSEQDRKEVADKNGTEGSATLQALLDIKHLLAPIHVLRVRSISYYALGEAEQGKAMEALGGKIDTPSAGTMANGPVDDEGARRRRGYERADKLMADAETFYKDLLTKQGGKVQMQLRGETSISIYAFEQPQTFAVVTRGPSRVIVARADGKPDVGAITGIFARVVGGN